MKQEAKDLTYCNKRFKGVYKRRKALSHMRWINYTTGKK